MDHFPSQPSKSPEGKSPIRPSQSVVSQRGWLLPAEVDELSTWLDKHKELMGPPFPSFPGDSGILAYRAEKSRWTLVNPGDPWWMVGGYNVDFMYFLGNTRAQEENYVTMCIWG